MTESTVPCSKCGAPIAENFFQARLTCTYCNVDQPNPKPLPADQEVLVPNQSGDYELGVATAMTGPDDISIAIGERAKKVKLADIKPVDRLDAKVPPATTVFVKGVGGTWELTKVVMIDGDTCTYLHDLDAFSAKFFDKTAPLDAFRIVHGAERGGRFPAKRGADRLFETGVKTIIGIGFVIVLVPFLLFFVAGLFGACGH